MSSPDIVTNASPLIYLALLNRFSLLRRFFDTVYLPEGVFQEVVVRGHGQPGAADTETALSDGWMQCAIVGNRIAVDGLLTELHLGEAEAIVLAREKNIRRILLDDRAARAQASMMDLTVTGTIGVLLLAQASGEISNIQDDLDRLIQENFRIAPALYARLTFGDDAG